MTEVRFEAADGWPLQGEVISPEGKAATCAVLISAGTAFPRQFYRPIAEHFASKGAAVLIFDYRGIGGSEGNPEDFAAIDYIDYAKDQSGAMAILRRRYPDLPLYHIAHSVGGHFWGLIPEHGDVTKHGFISVGTGYFGAHHKSYWPMSFHFWWVIGTYSLARFGELRPVLGWRGSKLPPKVFRTWRRWSMRRAYFSKDIPNWGETHFERVKAPIRSWIFEDDPIATKRSNADLMSVYPNAQKDVVYRAASDYGLRSIGHDGAFRKGREAIWDEIWEWLQA